MNNNLIALSAVTIVVGAVVYAQQDPDPDPGNVFGQHLSGGFAVDMPPVQVTMPSDITVNMPATLTLKQTVQEADGPYKTIDLDIADGTTVTIWSNHLIRIQGKRGEISFMVFITERISDEGWREHKYEVMGEIEEFRAVMRSSKVWAESQNYTGP